VTPVIIYRLPRAGARSVAVLVPAFGVTWVVGVFAVDDATLVFQWMFVILNALQVLINNNLILQLIAMQAITTYINRSRPLVPV